MTDARLLLLVILFICGLFTTSCMAVKITEKTNAANPENFKITINDLKDNSFFQLTIDGSFNVESGQPFAFGITNFSMPYDLKGAILTANVENGNNVALVVKKGDMILKKEADKNGTISVSSEIKSGTYENIQLTGNANNNKSNVKIKIQMSGMKIGPKDSTLSFTTEGISKGSATINVYVDKKKVFTTLQKMNMPSTSAIRTSMTIAKTLKTGTVALTPTPKITISTTTKTSNVTATKTIVQTLITTSVTQSKPVINFSRPNTQISGIPTTINPFLLFKR